MNNSNRLVCGWGIKDTSIPIRQDPLYDRWKNMIYRCRKPTNSAYKQYGALGVTICDEWQRYSNFYNWANQYDWKNKEIDKDLLSSDGKIYSPDTCCFLSQSVNTFITGITHGNVGKYPPGVYHNKGQSKSKPYKTQCCLNGKQLHLGRHATVAEAYKAYVDYKVKIALHYAENESDLRVKNGLIKFANNLIEDYLNREEELYAMV